MKKIITLSSLVILLFTTSCTRDYDCVCTQSNGRSRVAASIKSKGFTALAKSSVRKRCEAEAYGTESCQLVNK
jgi:hypothetical protein